MKFLSRVVWSEGMHLGPHHFQAQSRYFEDTLWLQNSHLRTCPWGFISFSIDHDSLRNGQAILTDGTGILPDGLIFDFPGCDQAPAPANLGELFSSMDHRVLLYLAIPPRRPDGVDCSSEPGELARFGSMTRTLVDDSSGQGEFEVLFARKNLLLTIRERLPAGAVAFPVVRVVRDGTGGFAADPDFFVPCLRIGVSDNLVKLLDRLLKTLNEKVLSVRSQRKALGRSELGTSELEVANYWFLHSLCSALPALHNHLADRRSHPEDVYRDLVRLAGALSTFSLEVSLDQIAPYLHDDLHDTFKRLDAFIRRNLEILLPTNTVTLQFTRSNNPHEPHVHTAPVPDERCLRSTLWFFGIRSSLPDLEVGALVPNLVKVCSHDVQKAVDRAVPGLTLTHKSVPPSALKPRIDMQYFSVSLSKDSVCWKHIEKSKQVGVYLPSPFDKSPFEVTIITEV